MGRWGRRYGGRGDYRSYMGFAPYVTVAERQARAAKQAAKLAGAGQALQPIRLDGRQIAATFWGKAWCENLESYSDFANRLPRGRSYVRNGSVLHLDIRKGAIEALVSGSSLYKIRIGIKPVAAAKWSALCKQCAGSIGSLVELLGGRLSERVMNVMTARDTGLFPAPGEIALDCSCPDWADMCKHVAAVLYGVGARLDHKPELLFTLRHVDHNELVSQASTVAALTDSKGSAETATLDTAEVSEVFGIELGTAETAAAQPATPPAKPVPPVPAEPAARTASRGTAKRRARKKTSRKPAKRKAHAGSRTKTPPRHKV